LTLDNLHKIPNKPTRLFAVFLGMLSAYEQVQKEKLLTGKTGSGRMRTPIGSVMNLLIKLSASFFEIGILKKYPCFWMQYRRKTHDEKQIMFSISMMVPSVDN